MPLEHIVHSIPPTYDERSRVLVLGSIPSPKSRETNYNYGHPQNRFWRVLAQIAGEPAPATNDRKRDFCLRHHIALWDVVAECDIEGASDSSIRNAQANDLTLITESAPIEAVFCTGAKSHDLYRRLGCEGACGIPAVKLPSTSPANAACSFEALVEAYSQVFEHTHEFEPPVLAVARVVELEQQIAASGTSLAELMDRAGTALAKRIRDLVDEIASGAAVCTDGAPSGNSADASRAPMTHVTIMCGSGNNGGDGWVAAELLARESIPVVVIAFRHPDELRAQPARDAAARSLGALMSHGGQLLHGDDALPLGEDGRLPRTPLVLVDPSEPMYDAVFERSGIIVDAILGTGFDAGTVKEPYCSWIRHANGIEGAVKLACDVASGVSAQHGNSAQQANERFLADETLTMIARKPGLSSAECGTVRVAPLAYIEPFLA